LARKILLADDSVTAQNMGRKILTDAGYEVVTVNNGSAALKKVAEQKPDLIVLDVYMPGYSGLEVCQRIKETKETSRIPILLTVGKLEPFKPEEARKARADAYVVKPFEASELLVALTKLEDKIVPQAEPYKPGRFAKAIAAVERFNQSESEDFGDSDSGWKKRIKFPAKKPAEPQAPPEISVRRHSILGLEDAMPPVEPSRVFERPIPEGLPKDITPEEIEAITAAAAQFRGADKSPAQLDVRQDAPPAPSEDSGREGASPVTLAGAPQERGEFDSSAEVSSAPQDARSDAEEARAPQYVSTPKGEQASDCQPSSQEHHPHAAPVSAEPVPVAEPEVAEAAASKGETAAPTEADAEWVAALQNLAPANGSGASEPAIANAVAAPNGPIGPRWIAEPVALDGSEVTLSLEQEMQKAFAAFAAADGARATFATNAAEPSATDCSEPVSMALAATQESGWQAPDSTYTTDSDSHSAIAAAAAEAATEISQQESAPPSAMASPVEASAPAEQTAATMVSSTDIAASVPENEGVADSTPSSSSAGDWESGASVPEPAELASVPDRSAASIQEEMAREQAPDQTAAQAAAWENWGQIRDAVLGPAAQVFDSTTTGSTLDQQQDSKPEAMAAAAAAGSDCSGSEGDSAIASIVDSVLAELKPKLMQEIARKMKKDSKKD
jgi:twitching motility two-component system response regulator PilH